VTEGWAAFVRELIGLVAPALPVMAVLALLPLGLLYLARRLRRDPAPTDERRRRRAVLAILATSLVGGYALVWNRLALYEDAFISFRFARNFADGHGLVWNLGERVEGYTNFLWTVTIGLLVRWTPWEAPGIGLTLSLAAFGGALAAIALLSRRLVGPRWLPLAVPLYAVHPVAVDYGSTGMETGLCALLVTLGALGLVRAQGAKDHALAGLALIAAALTRPDHGLFYAVGAGVVAGEQLGLLIQARRGGGALPWRDAARPVAGYAAPFVLYALYAAWKLQFYGALLPNTWWAKGAAEPWYSQGVIYVALFWVGTHAWIPALLALAAFARPKDRATARFGAFTIGSLLLFDGYVARVGGDYMHGRFLLSLLPLVLVGAEVAVHRLAQGGRPVHAAVALGLLLGSTWTPDLFDEREPRWKIVDENLFFPVSRVWPEIEVDRVHDRLGRFLRDEVRGRGLDPVIGTGSIGMVGYYSGLELIDCRGLTDATVAHGPIGTRNRPGHEKTATRAYLLEREVDLLRRRSGQQDFHPERFVELTRFSMLGAGIDDDWQIARYDRTLMRGLAAIPGVEFVDFDGWLDGYVSGLSKREPAQVAEDLAWFRAYHFDLNDDVARLRAIEDRAEGLLAVGHPDRPFAIVSLGALLGSAEPAPTPPDGDLLVGRLDRVFDPPDPTPQPGQPPPLAPGGLRPLERLGLDLVTLASPRAMAFGADGVAATMRGLERRRIASMGAGPDLANASRATLVSGGGVRIALLAVVQPTPEGAWAGRYATSAGAGLWGALPSEVAEVAELLRRSQEVDVVLVQVESDPVGGDIEGYVRALAEAGVELIETRGGGAAEIDRIGGSLVIDGGDAPVRYVFEGSRLARVELLPAGEEPRLLTLD
jgi:hypothetical protein